MAAPPLRTSLVAPEADPLSSGPPLVCPPGGGGSLPLPGRRRPLPVLLVLVGLDPVELPGVGVVLELTVGAVLFEAVAGLVVVPWLF